MAATEALEGNEQVVRDVTRFLQGSASMQGNAEATDLIRRCQGQGSAEVNVSPSSLFSLLLL